MGSKKLEFESPLPHKFNPLKPALVAGFEISEKNSVTTMSAYFYRNAVLVKAKRGWYIRYWFRIPKDLQHFYGGKEWLRFRVTEDINRRKGAEKEEYANMILKGIRNVLKNGFNPFDPAIDELKVESTEIELRHMLTCKEAFELFLNKWGQRGLEPTSMQKYEKCIKRLEKWTVIKGLHNQDVRKITTNHIEAFLNDCRKDYNSFSNREYNNTLGFIGTCFNYLVKKEIILKSPCAGIDKLKAPSTKHRFYDAVALAAITKAMQLKDPYIHFACQVIYHLCIRSEKELKNLKVGGIKLDENIVLINADGSKTKADRYIPMSSAIKQIFIDRGIMDYPAEYYVFGIKGVPAPDPFGKEFLSQRFGICRNLAGLPLQYTMMGFRHTRAVHLKLDGAKDSDIMNLMGHTDFATTAKYLRDLGVQANPKEISDRTRDI